MKMRTLTPIFIFGAVLLTGCSSHYHNKITDPAKTASVEAPVEITNESVKVAIENWPETSKSAANSMLTKYGLPHVINAETVVWYNTAPFKRSIVHKEEVPHNFPVPHVDVLEQVVEYRVPPSRPDDLFQYDGSILIDRTKGELSARCDKEEMNLLAINLADQIVRGKLSVEEARTEFGRSAKAFMNGNTNQLTNALVFIPLKKTADTDVAVNQQARPGLIKNKQGQTRQAQEAQDNLESDNMEE